MTITIEPDTRGVDALTGVLPDSVSELPLLIWEGLVADLGEMPDVPTIDPFDETPWQQLPTIEDLEELWCASPLATIIMHRLAIKAHGEGPDLPVYLARQWQLAEMELQFKRERELEQAVDIGRSREDGAVVPAASVRGGTGAAGGSENGDTLGKGIAAVLGKDTRRPPKVQGKRRSGNGVRAQQ